MKKIRIPWSVRLCLSVVFLAVLFALVPVRQLWQAMHGVSVGLWLTLLGLFLVCHVAAAFKWWWLTHQHADEVPLIAAIRAHFAGLATNLCLPGLAGGDVVRAAWVMRQAERRENVGVVAVTDRLLDCFALLFLACAGALSTGRFDGLVSHALLASGVMLGLAVLAAGGVYLWLRRYSGARMVGRIGTALGLLIARPWQLGVSLTLALIVQGGLVWLNVVLGRAAGVEAPAGAWFVAWPLAKLAATLPLSLGGLGIREGALVLFMQPFGAAAAPVTAASLLWQSIRFVGGLVGMVALIPARSPQVLVQQEAPTA